MRMYAQGVGTLKLTRRKQLNTEKNATRDELEKVRHIFERNILLKGLDFDWDGKRYKTTNIQTKWRYFCLGYFASREIA
jgi:hypothetical protein